MYKTIIFSAFMTMSFSALAATEIHDSEMANMKTEIGHISISVKNGTYSEAMKKLSDTADARHASHFRVTSMGRSGMGSDVTATAVIYQ